MFADGQPGIAAVTEQLDAVRIDLQRLAQHFDRLSRALIDRVERRQTHLPETLLRVPFADLADNADRVGHPIFDDGDLRLQGQWPRLGGQPRFQFQRGVQVRLGPGDVAVVQSQLAALQQRQRIGRLHLQGRVKVGLGLIQVAGLLV